ncbi:GDP-mannose 4,6-dehydratase [Candidatus Nomurabacteria bacterium]|nr:GDP-mannose 4,6-dehydratase [Candidatus Nomurabacteria bacterium]
MKINKLNVAVTGGAGFIGSHLVDKLCGSNNVFVIDNFATGKRENLPANVQILEGDVRDLQFLTKALRGVDVVFHLATHCVRLSLGEPGINHEVNATGTLNTLMASQKNNVKRFVYCSSSEVYGNTQEAVLNEESPKLPTTIYGASKLVGEYYTIAFHQTYGLSGMVIRPFNTYGPRSHFFGPYGEVIPRFTIWIRAGKDVVVFGDGLQTRDFTYVTDTARGLIEGAECDGLLGESVNLAHGEEISVLKIAETLNELNGKLQKIKHIESRPGDIRRLGADIIKAKTLFGFQAEVSIQDGLASYLKWLDQYHHNYPELAQKLVEKNWLI